MCIRQLLLVLTLVSSSGPLSAQPVEKDRIADLNHDGIPDTLAFADDPVPCDYDFLVTFTDGKSGKTIGVPREECCKCHIRRGIPIPPATTGSSSLTTP